LAKIGGIAESLKSNLWQKAQKLPKVRAGRIMLYLVAEEIEPRA
jgi:hypothetical protein